MNSASKIIEALITDINIKKHNDRILRDWCEKLQEQNTIMREALEVAFSGAIMGHSDNLKVIESVTREALAKIKALE